MFHHVSWKFGTMKDTTWPVLRAKPLFCRPSFKISHVAVHIILKTTINQFNWDVTPYIVQGKHGKKNATRQFHHLQRFKYPMDVWMFLHLSWRSTWQMRNLTTCLKLFNLAFDGHLMKPNGDTRGSMEKNTRHLLRLRKHYQNIPALKLHGSCIGRYRSGRSLYVPYRTCTIPYLIFTPC